MEEIYLNSKALNYRISSILESILGYDTQLVSPLYDFINVSLELDKVLCDSIRSIADILAELETYRFVHNDLTSKSVLVDIDEYGSLVFKLSGFDSSYIEYQDQLIGPQEYDLGYPPNLLEISMIDTDYFKINPIGISVNYKLGAYYRNIREKVVSLDFYTFVLSLIFHPRVMEEIDYLPKFNQMVDRIFKDKDIDKIKDFMYVREVNTTDLAGWIIANNIELLYNPLGKL